MIQEFTFTSLSPPHPPGVVSFNDIIFLVFSQTNALSPASDAQIGWVFSCWVVVLCASHSALDGLLDGLVSSAKDSSRGTLLLCFCIFVRKLLFLVPRSVNLWTCIFICKPAVRKPPQRGGIGTAGATVLDGVNPGFQDCEDCGTASLFLISGFLYASEIITPMHWWGWGGVCQGFFSRHSAALLLHFRP